MWSNRLKNWTAKEIEGFRKTRGLTRKALGELLGVTISSIYQWEKEVRKPSKTTKILLSKIEEEHTKKEKEVNNHGDDLPER
jgi:DNA-binding transcriptional regulator YiaG